jgi:hypothetical protein
VVNFEKGFQNGLYFGQTNEGWPHCNALVRPLIEI